MLQKGLPGKPRQAFCISVMPPSSNRKRPVSVTASAAAAVGIVIAAAAVAIPTAAAVGITVATAAASVGITRIDEQPVGCILLGREKLVDRELEVGKNLTGILLPANTAVRAVAARQADVKCRHEQLDIALQADNSELAQGNEQLVAVVAQHQVIAAETRADRTRHFVQRTAAAIARGIGRNNARVQQDRVNDLNDRSRFVAVRAKLDIVFILYKAGRENARAAFAAEQDHALVKHGKPVNDARTADHAADLAFNAVEEADVNRVEASVKRYLSLPHH